LLAILAKKKIKKNLLQYIKTHRVGVFPNLVIAIKTGSMFLKNAKAMFASFSLFRTFEIKPKNFPQSSLSNFHANFTLHFYARHCVGGSIISSVDDINK
jgi:hypothetical protein